MNLLLALWVVGCIAAAVIVSLIPAEVWSAVAERIRTPRRSRIDWILEANHQREAALLRAAERMKPTEQSDKVLDDEDPTSSDEPTGDFDG